MDDLEIQRQTINDALKDFQKIYEALPLAEGILYYGERNALNQRDGTGAQVWPDGSVYIGQWFRDRATGIGKMLHGDSGDIYEGNWLNDLAHGKGTYFNSKSGAIYEGDWVLDKQNGYGLERWPDGTQYSGSFLDGQKHGRGQIDMVNKLGEKHSYTGEFSYNSFNGYGVYTFPQSSTKSQY